MATKTFAINDIVKVMGIPDVLFQVFGYEHTYKEQFSYKADEMIYFLKSCTNGQVMKEKPHNIIYFGKKSDKIIKKDIDRMLDEYNLLMARFEHYRDMFRWFADTEYSLISGEALDEALNIKKQLKELVSGDAE